MNDQLWANRCRERWLAELPADAREPMTDAPIADFFLRARSAHPHLDIDPGTFAAHVAARVTDRFSPQTLLSSLHVEDLYLACGCLLGISAALNAFEARHGRELRQAVSRVWREDNDVDELAQIVKTKILVGEEGRPRLREYSGRGPLAGWLSVVVTNELISRRRQLRGVEQVDVDELEELPAGSLELELIQASHQHHFKRAFQAALATLTPKERNVLRLYVLEELNIAQIGVLYGAHRATVARWIASSREKLLLLTRQELASALKVGAQDLDSLVRAVELNVDVSLERFLASST